MRDPFASPEKAEKVSQRHKTHFPWRIAGAFLVHQFVFAIILFISLGFATRFVTKRLFFFDHLPKAFVMEFDQNLSFILWSGFSIFALHSLFSAWYFFRPLSRLIQKARALRRQQFKEIAAADLFEIEEPGEWADLDRALVKIQGTLAQKRKEFTQERAELQAIVSSVDDSIVAINRELYVKYYNSRFAMLFKRRRSENLGDRIEEIFREPDLLQGFKVALTGQRPDELLLWMETSRHKLPRQYRIALSPLLNDEDGSVFGAVAVFHDETEARTAEQVRIDFVANASHELRTPLTSIQGYMQTIKEDLGTGRAQDIEKFVDIVLRNVDRLKALVNDLLDISALDSGSEIKKEGVDVVDLTDVVLRQLEGIRLDKNLKIKTRFDIQEVYGDFGKLEQVLLNLTHNSMKYISAGSEINIIFAEENEKYDVMIVEDNGPGIPIEHQDRLFERFYRIDKGRAREVGGTGLGLSIVKHIMVKHEGEVKLVSEPGQGTQFRCLIPKRPRRF